MDRAVGIGADARIAEVTPDRMLAVKRLDGPAVGRSAPGRPVRAAARRRRTIGALGRGGTLDLCHVRRRDGHADRRGRRRRSDHPRRRFLEADDSAAGCRDDPDDQPDEQPAPLPCACPPCPHRYPSSLGAARLRPVARTVRSGSCSAPTALLPWRSALDEARTAEPPLRGTGDRDPRRPGCRSRPGQRHTSAPVSASRPSGFAARTSRSRRRRRSRSPSPR